MTIEEWFAERDAELSRADQAFVQACRSTDLALAYEQAREAGWSPTDELMHYRTREAVRTADACRVRLSNMLSLITDDEDAEASWLPGGRTVREVYESALDALVDAVRLSVHRAYQ